MGSPASQYFPPAERKKIENAIPAPATAAPVPTAGTFANPVLSKQYFKAMAAAGNNPYWGDPSYKDYDPAKRLLKPIIPGKPNPNIGMGLKTPSSLPQFGEPGWVNPNYDPYHNAAGYHRFDPTIPGMGLQMHKTYADGAASYDSYQKLTPGAGYAATSNQFLTENGINPATATDMQKFAAMDYAGRLGQWKNQRPKRKFGIKDAFGLALSVGAIFVGDPYLAVAMASGGSALQGGDIGDIAAAAGTTAAFNVGGGKAGKALASSAKAGSKLAQFGVKALPYLKAAGQTVGAGLAAGNAIRQSGVNLSPDQYSLREGGNPKITTFEPENKNIAFDAHPTSAYLAAYPSAPASTETTASPITPTQAAPIAGTETAARPYVAPPQIPIAPNIPIVNYDPSRNYAQLTQQLSPRAPTMQQALMRPAATRRRSQNARTA